MTIHNLGDLWVDFGGEILYHDRVAANGKSALLTQRAIRGASHCGFTAVEQTRAFSDMVLWSERIQKGDNTKPEGDSLAPAAVASKDYGCKFTVDAKKQHLLAPAC